MDNKKQLPLNVNIGVLGHIDSGKTSICKVLSQITSTASLDKHPQSQERGITLDLGFSAFYIDDRQYTLVDCPGHASLIKTIIGGAQIIDIMILVVDVQKGIQTQTAECLVIGEILLYSKKLVIALNKIDMVKQDELDKRIVQLKKILAKTPFKGEIPIVPISAQNNLGFDELIKNIKDVEIDRQNVSQQPQDLLFLIDHSFPIKGQGTVTTGTIIQGKIKVNDDIYFPEMKITKKVKSLQMFKKPVQSAGPGDRVAALFVGLEKMERGIICYPGIVVSWNKIIIRVNKVSYYKGSIKSGNKFHITSGHQTIMGILKLYKDDGEYVEELGEEKTFALIELEKELLASRNSMIIGSKFDSDLNANICRLAFYGVLHDNNQIQIYREKKKEGEVEKVVDNYTLLIKNLFKKETNIQLFIGKEVVVNNTNNKGVIDSAFGKSGKVKVFFKDGIYNKIDENLNDDEKNKILVESKVTLIFKKYHKQ